MVAILTLLALLTPLAGSQSEAPSRVAAATSSTAPSSALSTPVDLDFQAELETLQRACASLAAARVDTDFLLAERMPRFIELAQRGSSKAAAFVLANLASGSIDLRHERELKLELYRAIERTPDAPWLTDPELAVHASLRRDASLLGISRARALARSLQRNAGSDEQRARALLAEAWIELDESGEQPSAERRARALLDEVMELFPRTFAAAEAKALLWRLDHLVVGAVAPNFAATDVDGNELRLSDWSRRVVLVEFWSFADAGIEERLAARRQLYERFREERFAIVGINLDTDEPGYRRGIEEFGIEWPNAYTGGIEERVIWKIRGPANLILKPGNIIQQVDVGESQLEGVIERLIAEGKEHGDQRAHGSGPPIR
jgi:hypothetical protein